MAANGVLQGVTAPCQGCSCVFSTGALRSKVPGAANLAAVRWLPPADLVFNRHTYRGTLQCRRLITVATITQADQRPNNAMQSKKTRRSTTKSTQIQTMHAANITPSAGPAAPARSAPGWQVVPSQPAPCASPQTLLGLPAARPPPLAAAHLALPSSPP